MKPLRNPASFECSDNQTADGTIICCPACLWRNIELVTSGDLLFRHADITSQCYRDWKHEPLFRIAMDALIYDWLIGTQWHEALDQSATLR